MLRTAAGRRALQAGLLVGGVLLIGLLCGERAHAADGVRTPANSVAVRTRPAVPQIVSGAGSVHHVRAVGERAEGERSVRERGARASGVVGQVLSGGRGEARAKVSAPASAAPASALAPAPAPAPAASASASAPSRSPERPSPPPPARSKRLLLTGSVLPESSVSTTLPKFPAPSALPTRPPVLPESPVAAALPKLPPLPDVPLPPTLPDVPPLPTPPAIPALPTLPDLLNPPELSDLPNLPGPLDPLDPSDALGPLNPLDPPDVPELPVPSDDGVAVPEGPGAPWLPSRPALPSHRLPVPVTVHLEAGEPVGSASDVPAVVQRAEAAEPAAAGTAVHGVEHRGSPVGQVGQDHAGQATRVGHAPVEHGPGGRPDGALGNRAVADNSTPRHGDAHAVTLDHRAPLRLVPGATARSYAAATRDRHRDVSAFPG
ncbi:hypothetical protein C1703_24070 [Streptomyces sp. Go-475]|nr:hypothetical protein C1703_24070 [Streptomyces sp. Go-475]